MIVLDTDHLTFLERREGGPSHRLRARLDKLPLDDVATTIVNYGEQTRGWMSELARSRSQAQQIAAYRRLSDQLRNYCRLHVLDFGDEAAVELQRLRSQRIRIGTMDLKIAAVVLAHDATLLSRNLVDFRRVPGLKVEDWTA